MLGLAELLVAADPGATAVDIAPGVYMLQDVEAFRADHDGQVNPRRFPAAIPGHSLRQQCCNAGSEGMITASAC